MSKKLSLNKTQLQIIAIISMVIDHTAWGFLDFHTPLAQFLHVCGRLTIPIMCFFVAEGFRKTSNLQKYVLRMCTFAVVSVIPFYVFFHEEYGYRQNFIFDLTLGLLMLVCLESGKLPKWAKVLLTAGLFIVSAVIGGWPVTPQCFILAFYYGRTFKEKAKWVCIADCATVAILVPFIILNSIYHFSSYEWVWWDKFYLLGFMLALPLLACYNGEKGKTIVTRYFFYAFYPAHFLILAGIKALFVSQTSGYNIYLAVHIITLVMLLAITGFSMAAKPSKGQVAIVAFEISASVYVFGFIVEILASTADGYYLACLIQYFGEFMTFVCVVIFVAAVCRVEIPNAVIALHVLASSLIMWSLVCTRKTGFFYSYIGVNDQGPFSRPELVHSWGYFLSVVYITIMCIEVLAMCIHSYRIGTGLQKKRIRLIYWSMFFCWIPWVITLTGVTGGYEIPAVGILGCIICLAVSFFRYGMIDSVALASENALEHANEGVMVLDNRYRILFHNRLIDDVLGDIPHTVDVRKYPQIREIMDGTCDALEKDGRIYEFQIEPLMEHGYVQGQMVWVLDATEHFESMKRVSEEANRDNLTGLHNRTYFKELVDEDVKEGRSGCFIMMDMDNFKQVNDHFGHQRGDTVLKSLADILLDYPEDMFYSCRVGGDEYCAYMRDETDPEKIRKTVSDIMERFAHTFREEDEIRCTLSAGAFINDGNRQELIDCSAMYMAADSRLYEAKAGGKNRFIMK